MRISQNGCLYKKRIYFWQKPFARCLVGGAFATLFFFMSWNVISL